MGTIAVLCTSYGLAECQCKQPRAYSIDFSNSMYGSLFPWQAAVDMGSPEMTQQLLTNVSNAPRMLHKPRTTDDHGSAATEVKGTPLVDAGKSSKGKGGSKGLGGANPGKPDGDEKEPKRRKKLSSLVDDDSLNFCFFPV